MLLKNDQNVLPLKAPRSIAVVGNGAGNSSQGPNGYVQVVKNLVFSCSHELVPSSYTDRGGDDGVLGMGWGSGSVNHAALACTYQLITLSRTANYPYLVAVW